MNPDLTLFLRCIVLLFAGVVVLACSLPWLYRAEDSLTYRVASRVASATAGGMFAVAVFMVGRLLWVLWVVAGAL